MGYIPHRGGTLLIPSGPSKHLFVILTDRCQDGMHLLVSLSTIKPGRFHDNACIVEPGEHRFVKRPSFIEYRRPRRDTASHLVTCVNGWTFTPHDDVTDAVFKRICHGIHESKFIPQGMKRYYEEQCGF